MNVKKGLDFFLLDTIFDDSIKLIKAEFGASGIGIVIMLWQKIYGGEGYYCEWNKDVALLFASEVGAGGNVVSEVVSACLRRGIFDKSLFDKYQILTSARIQRHYFEAVKRRKDVSFNNDFLLVPITAENQNVDISSENANILPENVDSLRQKREENKREDNKIHKSAGARTGAYNKGDFETDDFFSAALKKSYE